MSSDGKVTETPKFGKLTARATEFCRLVSLGESYATAYKIAYSRPKLLPKDAGNRGWLVAQHPNVIERIASLRKTTAFKTILTINEQLRMTAEIAQKPTAKDSDKISALKHYASISGDLAPHDVNVKVEGSVAVEHKGNVTVTNVSVRQRAAALREARKRKEEEKNAPQT